MDSKLTPMVVFAYIFLLGYATSAADIDKDRAECADQVIGLATCLPYVGGEAKAPTIDCCSGLKQVLDKSKKCLCILIKDKDDPSLGLKINASLAASLPTVCHSPASVANISQCISLLHLTPNSPEAKIFQGFGNISTTPAASVKGNPKSGSTTSADEKGDGGRLRIEILGGVLVLTFTLQSIISAAAGGGGI